MSVPFMSRKKQPYISVILSQGQAILYFDNVEYVTEFTEIEMKMLHRVFHVRYTHSLRFLIVFAELKLLPILYTHTYTEIFSFTKFIQFYLK